MEKAKALLAEAGYPDGFAMEIEDEPYSSDLVRGRLIDYLLGKS